MLALEKEWVTSLLFYFQDTPTAKFAITPLTWSTFFAIICIITSSVPKLTFIPECAPKPLSSSKFSTGPSWIQTKCPWTCLEVAPQLLVKTTQSWANRQKTRQKLDCKKFVKLTDHTYASNSLTNFQYEAHSTTRNGFYVNLMKVAWKHSWNHFRWTNFWRVLRRMQNKRWLLFCWPYDH